MRHLIGSDPLDFIRLQYPEQLYLTLQREGRVLQVSFNAGNSVNSLGQAMMRELTELAEQ